MSRYCPDRDIKPMINAAEHWRQHGLLNDGSILTDKAIWKPEYLEDLTRYFINQPDAGEGSFFEKLSKQLAPTAPEVKQLAAEILWVMLLCPSNIREAKKREGIATIWAWSEEPFPEDSPWLQDEVLSGIGSAGTGYNTNRWRELVFVIRVVSAIKQLPNPERTQLLNDGWTLAKWLEQIPECDSRQFRHMMLFLLFPDTFERIFGGTDRRRIVASFTGKSDAQSNNLSALGIDRALAETRKQQEEIYGMTDIDFYVPPLRDLWGTGRNMAWLLVWNPDNWPWENLAADRAATYEGKTVTLRYTCANRNAGVGDKAYLLRTAVDPKGIVATGNIVTAPYEDAHYDEQKAAKGETAWYVEVAFNRIQDPLAGDSYLTKKDLDKITIEQQNWSPQSSGIEIKPRTAGILKKLWENLVESDIKPAATKKEPGIAEATNLILYGPPGTGETYQLNRLIGRYSSKKQTISREAWLIQQLIEVRWFDTVFAALYDLGGKAKVALITGHEFIISKARALGRTQNIAQTVWATLQAHASETSATVQYKNKSAPFVFDKTSDSVWSLVGDWQEECPEQVSFGKTLKTGPQEESGQSRYEFVTFHQAYSYEDFVEGIRPVQDEGTGEFAYQVTPGVFNASPGRQKQTPVSATPFLSMKSIEATLPKFWGNLSP